MKAIIRELFEIFGDIFLGVVVTIIVVLYITVAIALSPIWAPMYLISGLSRWAYSDEHTILQAYYLEGKDWLKAL